MEKVLVSAKVENEEDFCLARRHLVSAGHVRRAEVSDALVDTATTMLSMPNWLIAQLGLRPTRVFRARTADGITPVQVYGAVRLIVQGRDCVCEVAEVPGGGPVVVGRVPLLMLGLVVDPAGRGVVADPEPGWAGHIELYQ